MREPRETDANIAFVEDDPSAWKVAAQKESGSKKAGSSERRTIVRWLNIGCVVVSLAFSLHPAAGAEPKPLVGGAPVRLPLIEGNDIRFTHRSAAQGLSQSRVDHMLQDRRGFIWIGTYNGLNRYDGYRFKTYKPDLNNPTSLGGLGVFALFEDRCGMLWIGIDQQLDRFDPTTGTFTHFRAVPGNANSPSGYVEHMTQDRDGMLWVATRDGLDRLDPASGRFTHYRSDLNDPHGLSSNDCRFVLAGRQGCPRLWATANDGPGTRFHFSLPQRHEQEHHARVRGSDTVIAVVAGRRRRRPPNPRLKGWRSCRLVRVGAWPRSNADG